MSRERRREGLCRVIVTAMNVSGNGRTLSGGLVPDGSSRRRISTRKLQVSSLVSSPTGSHADKLSARVEKLELLSSESITKFSECTLCSFRFAPARDRSETLMDSPSLTTSSAFPSLSDVYA